MRFKFILPGIMLAISCNLSAQYSSEYSSGLKVNFNEEGTKYLRTILWGQFWFQDTEGSSPNDGISVRRARVLMYSQINKKFLFLIHWGLNSLNDNNLSPLGKSTDASLFLHDAWAEYAVTPKHYIGAGLHYWNGISRINNSSTLNFMTMDANRSNWTTLGLTDQFARHLGVYGKGSLGKLQYRVSINDVLTNSLDGNPNTVLEDGQIRYLGKALTDNGKYAYAGYLEYNFLESESNTLPFKVGTYLGAKKVFNVGGGVFYHQDGLVKNEGGELINKDVMHAALDAYYDAPIGGKGAALNAYALVQHSEMGGEYLLGNLVGDGTQFYGHVGYLLPKKIKEGEGAYKNRFQPYVAYSHRDFKGLVEPAKELRFGGNWYVDGQNAKITVEYQKSIHLPRNRDDMFTIQAMIFL